MDKLFAVYIMTNKQDQTRNGGIFTMRSEWR